MMFSSYAFCANDFILGSELTIKNIYATENISSKTKSNILNEFKEKFSTIKIYEKKLEIRECGEKEYMTWRPESGRCNYAISLISEYQCWRGIQTRRFKFLVKIIDENNIIIEMRGLDQDKEPQIHC